MRKYIAMACLAFGATAFAQDTANVPDHARIAQMHRHCVNATTDSTTEMYSQGKCIGAIYAIIRTNSKICEPNGWTLNQAARIVVQDMERVPAAWQHDFVIAISVALERAWPCAASPANQGRRT